MSKNREDGYKSGERFSADMSPAFPDREKIVCRDCVFRKRSLMGEVNSFCDMYASGMGKPYDVLFQNGPCQFHTKEEKERRRRHREEDAHREFTPIHAQWADPAKMPCRDCEFRDRTVVELVGYRFEAGIARSNCEIYPNKPDDIYFMYAPCQYYRKDPDATGIYKTAIEKKAAD